MFDYLEKLRKKPERVKKQIAFLISFAIVGVIFVVWLTVIYPDFRQNEEASAVLASTTPSPISAFSDTFSSGISAISEEFSRIKESISSFSSGSVYYNATSTNATPGE